MYSFISFLLANLALWTGLIYTPPSSRLRPLLVLLIIPLSLTAARSDVLNIFPGGVGAEYAIGFMFHANNFLLLARLSPPSSDPLLAAPWGVNQLLSARWGTKVPPGAPYTRQGLFLRRAFDAALLWAIAYLIQRYGLETSHEDFVYVPNEFLTRLGDVSRREWLVRVWTAGRGYTNQYLGLRICHSLATCVAMVCGQDPDEWPPLFGDAREAWSVRRYFGKFWHYCMRKAFTSHAVAVCKGVGLPLGHPVTRAVIMVLVFGMSAVMHMLCMPGFERCSMWPQVRYYLSIIAAILVEDMVIGAYKGVKRLYRRGQKARKPRSVAAYEHQQPLLALRVIGYVWVLAFHTWAGSVLIFGLWSHCSGW